MAWQRERICWERHSGARACARPARQVPFPSDDIDPPPLVVPLPGGGEVELTISWQDCFARGFLTPKDL